MTENSKLKKLLFPVFGVAIAIILILIGYGTDKTSKSDETNKNMYPSDEALMYTEFLEKRVTSLLSDIEGIKNVNVLITLDGSNKNIYADNGQNTEIVIVTDKNGIEKAIKVTEINAELRGIAIVCDYGNNENLKKEIINLLASLFNIGSNRISVIQSK